MVPGAASTGSVLPMVARATLIACVPSHTMATTGPDVMKSTSDSKKGLSPMLGVVTLGELARDPHELHGAQHQATALETRHDLADQAARDAVGLDHDERSLHLYPRGGDRPAPGA